MYTKCGCCLMCEHEDAFTAESTGIKDNGSSLSGDKQPFELQAKRGLSTHAQTSLQNGIQSMPICHLVNTFFR